MLHVCMYVARMHVCTYAVCMYVCMCMYMYTHMFFIHDNKSAISTHLRPIGLGLRAPTELPNPSCSEGLVIDPDKHIALLPKN